GGNCFWLLRFSFRPHREVRPEFQELRKILDTVPIHNAQRRKFRVRAVELQHNYIHPRAVFQISGEKIELGRCSGCSKHITIKVWAKSTRLVEVAFKFSFIQWGLVVPLSLHRDISSRRKCVCWLVASPRDVEEVTCNRRQQC